MVKHKSNILEPVLGTYANGNFVNHKILPLSLIVVLNGSDGRRNKQRSRISMLNRTSF
jgi:hypothetical protein